MNFVSPAATAQTLLDEAERDQLRQIVDKLGLNAAARTLNLSRGVISSAIAGIAVRRGSIELVRESLAAYSKGAK